MKRKKKKKLPISDTAMNSLRIMIFSNLSLSNDF